MHGKTIQQYNDVVDECRYIFLNKAKDYGTGWRVLRNSSLTDQLFIKAKRIRTIQDVGVKKVNENIEGEFIGMVNYGLMALIQLDLEETDTADLNNAQAEKLYDEKIRIAREIMESKNHDYGEAWREMRISSLVDLILTKLLRIKQIEDNEGRTIVSEGIDSNYIDIINYSIFSLIKLKETP